MVFHEAYKTVIISSIASIIFFIGAFFYRYLFPKKKLNLLVVLLFISILPIISIFRPGVYESGDFTDHIFRTTAFYQSLTEGNIFPSWAGNLNATYGYPLFIFNYNLPYYLISLFHFLGFTFITSMKLFLATSFLLSGIFMYFAAQKLFKNPSAAFVTAIFYQFVPYHLIDLHFKVVIGELALFTVFPIVFLSLLNLWERKSFLWCLITGFTVSLLIMSHVSIAVFCLALLFAYTIFNTLLLKKSRILFSTALSFTMGSSVTTYIWATPFFLSKYTIVAKMTFPLVFPPLQSLLFSPYRFGLLFQGPKGEISLLLGYTQLLVIIIIFVLIICRKILLKHKPYILFWLFAFFVSVFMITPYSRLMWDTVPFLKTTGGSQRFLLLAAFTSSLLAGYLSIYLKKKKILLWSLLFVTIFGTILNWGQRTVLPQITEQMLIRNAWTENQHFYANSRWRDLKNPWFTSIPPSHIMLITGKATIKEIARTSTQHIYIITTITPVTIQENTLYFPGWQASDNMKDIPTYPDSNGTISFKLEKGLHYVSISYHDAPILRSLKMFSLIILLTMGIFLCYLLLPITLGKREN